MVEQESHPDSMLPQPSANFTLPSLYDNLELDCRLYFPRHKSAEGVITATGCAIFAHPYAPLGGCYDDPVVNSVGSVLLKQGYILTTFNFRGAEQSPGKTSWSGRGELGDYVSMYALCIAFLNVRGISDHISTRSATELDPVLLLGGYSYGSMIAAYLPKIEVVVDCLLNATDGSPEKEIEIRAQELGAAFLGYCETQNLRGRAGSRVSDPTTPRRGVQTFGGYESPDAARRISRDRSHRKVEVERVRHSVERVRRKLSGQQNDSRGGAPSGGNVDASKVPALTLTLPKIRFLLVSPLLGSVAGLATMFSRLKFERRGKPTGGVLSSTVPEEALSQHSSLIVHGSSDHFTSSAKVRAWCDSIKSRPGSLLTSSEIEGAGHFWHDGTNEQKLQRVAYDWLGSIS